MTTSYPQTPYLIDDIIPMCSVNLMGGASGSGKSRMSFQGMYEIQTTQTLFGYKCLSPIHQEYIAYDRTLASIHTTLNRMELHLGDLPLSSYVTEPATRILTPAMISPGCNLLWIDGIECLTDKLIDFHNVGSIVKAFVRFAVTQQVSIIALMGMAKVKESERYANSREELIGSTAWGRFSDTIFTIGCKDDNISNERTFKILPRNSKAFVKTLAFDTKGHLVEIISNDEPTVAVLVMKLFIDHPRLTTADIIGYTQDAGFSESAAKKTIDYLLNQGKIRKVHHGLYEKSYIS